MEIIEGMKEGSPLILNKDDDMLADLDCPQMKKIYYGIERSDCDVHAKDIQEEGGHTSFTIVYEGADWLQAFRYAPEGRTEKWNLCCRRLLQRRTRLDEGSNPHLQFHETSKR